MHELGDAAYAKHGKVPSYDDSLEGPGHRLRWPISFALKANASSRTTGIGFAHYTAKCCGRSRTVAPLCWADIGINALVAAIAPSRITVVEIAIVPSVRTALAINGSRLVVTSC